MRVPGGIQRHGAGFNNGDNDGRPSVVPLPTAMWLFPAGALLAAAAAARLCRRLAAQTSDNAAVT